MQNKQHSIRVPRLYKIASDIYKKVKDEGASLKNILYQANHPNKKGIFALVLTTLQKDIKLDFLLKKSQFLTKEPGIQVPLARILIAELLWGKKRLSSECRPIKSVLAYQQIFQAYCTDINDDPPEYTNQRVFKPRFVRVNTLKLSVNEAVDGFRDEDWTLKRFTGDNYSEFLDQVYNLGEYEFMVDLHVSDLLVFPARTEFFKHVAYKRGEITLQDKASCLPVTLLNPPPGSNVLDMCAAPGMKTTQLAALINDSGKVYAVEKDANRLETLKCMIASSGATCVETIFKDVLTVDAQLCPDVEYILVDPSCSGTGITDRYDLDKDANGNSQERVNKLRGFQIMVLKHALRSFPTVKRIVYSTCSVLAEENEGVVDEVMASNPSFKLLDGKTLLKSWDNYGSDDYAVGKYCIYARPEHDFTNGFFVAVFERLQEGEVNEFLKEKDVSYKMKYLEKDVVVQESQVDDEIEYNNENNANLQEENTESLSKKSKKKKKTKEIETTRHEHEEVKIAKKKRKHVDISEEIPKKKKKKTKENVENETLFTTLPEHETELSKKKSKKSKKHLKHESTSISDENGEINDSQLDTRNGDDGNIQENKEKSSEIDENPKKKKKKSKGNAENETLLSNLPQQETESSKKKSKKKKKHLKHESTTISDENGEINDSQMTIKENKEKSKKKKRKNA